MSWATVTLCVSQVSYLWRGKKRNTFSHSIKEKRAKWILIHPHFDLQEGTKCTLKFTFCTLAGVWGHKMNDKCNSGEQMEAFLLVLLLLISPSLSLSLSLFPPSSFSFSLFLSLSPHNCSMCLCVLCEFFRCMSGLIGVRCNLFQNFFIQLYHSLLSLLLLL